MSDYPFYVTLRAEVRLEEARLLDELTGNSYPLQVIGRLVANAARARLRVADLVSNLAVACKASQSQVERELRQMVLLGLLEDTCCQSRERLQSIRNGERLVPHVLEGSRFGCQNSGACCRGYVFGSIEEEEKLRIEALQPRKALPHLGEAPLFIETGTNLRKPTYRLGTVGEACVFLEEGPRCGLHRAFGAAAKPSFCQLYPLAAVATIDGLKIYDRGECATFAVSTTQGTLLANDIARISALVDPAIYHPMAQLHGSWRCDYGLILALGRRLDQEVLSHSPLFALRTIGNVARNFIIALTHCPLQAGQPEMAATAALACSGEIPDGSQRSVTASARAGLHKMAILATALAERVAPQETFAPSFAAAAGLLAELCQVALGEALLSERHRNVIAIPMHRDCEIAMSLSLRQQIFGRELLLDDQLPAGLLRMAFVVALTLTGARQRACDAGSKVALPQHFSASHMIAKRTLHRPEPHGLLRLNGEQAWCILDALPVLADHLGFPGHPSPSLL